MTAPLVLDHVSRSYGTGPAMVTALHDVSLTVSAGELVAVMGPSGSGKSTLLTIAGGLEQASAGEVLVDGVSLSTMSRSQSSALRRSRIGYVFQAFNLLPALTAKENVMMSLELDGVKRKVAQPSQA